MMINANTFTGNTDLVCLLCAERKSPLECESAVNAPKVGRRQRVGTHELPGDGVIVAGVHVDQAAGILLLPGEAVVRGHGGGGQAVLAVGVVALVPARR